jgi:hypothetical protein
MGWAGSSVSVFSSTVMVDKTAPLLFPPPKTTAVIFYAIVTKIGPHSETSNPEHRFIGGNAGKSQQ